jgi:hypothetical protein
LNDSSIRGEKLRDINAVPAKEILKNKARVCPPISAVCEIMDNIFDNFEENGSSHDLSISVVVRSAGDGEISIAENSGGVRESKLEPLVRLGVPYHAARGSIGTWGEGFKVAAFSLGTELEVITHFPGEKPVVVHFDENWLSSTDWNVPLYSAAPGVARPGTTTFRIRRLVRKIGWADIMRELSVIYGHKVQAIIDSGRRVHFDFDIDGARTPLRPRPLASTRSLRERMAYPPDFSPRQFSAQWRTEHGSVRCKLIIGLTPRHSTDTSGVYMYGNGRMFTRALRSRAVGYGDGPNSVLRDHPSCWRIHAYAFFEADDGADIPWQAPLKDGVSENHPITTKFREMFKSAVTPYSRFARIAKASELLPFTNEWGEYTYAEKAETLFRSKSPGVLEGFKELPKEVREFSPPTEIETVRIDGVAGEELVSQLDRHAKYLRQMITKRDEGGPALELDVLRALIPTAFADEKRGAKKKVVEPPAKIVKKTRVSFEIESIKVTKLMAIFGTSHVDEAVKAAIAFAVKNAAATKPVRRSGRK